jgi:serine/threonine kinase 38
MEQTRSWFNRFQPRDRAKGSSGKMKVGSAGSDSGKESVKSSRDAAAEELPSSITRQKVAAAKQYIENHYKSQMKSLQERKERYVFTSPKHTTNWSPRRNLAQRRILRVHAC